MTNYFVRLPGARAPSNALLNFKPIGDAIEGWNARRRQAQQDEQNAMYRGKADWDKIAGVKQKLRRIPLIGNGDITTVDAALLAFSRYGVDGIMIGRAAMARPWLFAQIEAAVAGAVVPPEPSLAEQAQILLDHFRLMVERFGEYKGSIIMRRYACCRAQGLPGARRFRANVAMAKTAEQFEAVVRRDFPKNHDSRGFGQ